MPSIRFNSNGLTADDTTRQVSVEAAAAAPRPPLASLVTCTPTPTALAPSTQLGPTRKHRGGSAARRIEKESTVALHRVRRSTMLLRGTGAWVQLSVGRRVVVADWSVGWGMMDGAAARWPLPRSSSVDLGWGAGPYAGWVAKAPAGRPSTPTNPNPDR